MDIVLCDDGGAALPGFGPDECDVLIGDELARTASWCGRCNLSPFAGRTVRLRFLLEDADVFEAEVFDELA